jgi:hypothetical protein
MRLPDSKIAVLVFVAVGVTAAMTWFRFVKPAKDALPPIMLSFSGFAGQENAMVLTNTSTAETLTGIRVCVLSLREASDRSCGLEENLRPGESLRVETLGLKHGDQVTIRCREYARPIERIVYESKR